MGMHIGGYQGSTEPDDGRESLKEMMIYHTDDGASEIIAHPSREL
jgi:hypothetical protein